MADVVWKCIVCNKEVPDYIPEYCCDGLMCGCRGQPIEPCICSQKCWDELINGKNVIK